MSITAAELIEYGSASKPADDASLAGGAIDATMRPSFAQLTANAVISAVSSAADTRTLTIVGRDPTGLLVTTTLVLQGTAAVTGTQIYERLFSATLSATGAQTVTVQQGAGGPTIATIPPNETGFYAMFQNAFSSTAQQVRYENTFWKNTDGTTTLTGATVTLTADPAVVTTVGLAAAVGDSGNVNNRTLAPTGVVFSGVGVALTVPGGGNLAPGAAIGVWIAQTLAANAAPVRATFTTQLAGNTT